MLPVILILIIIIVVWQMDLLSYVYPTSAEVAPVEAPSAEAPSAEAPPAEVLGCVKGIYCDGSPVPEEQSGIGAKICGYNNYIYNCVKSIVGPRWQTNRASCDAGMVGRC